jgi:predicted enzyme related to lactoylglutathione lyase
MSNHQIVHIEIPSRNFQESGEFYHALFGWKIIPAPEMNYTMWEPATGPGGGFSPLGENVSAGDVLIYVDSDNIEADLKKAVKLGGKLLTPKSEIPGTGWFGIFQDLTGNNVALYTALLPQGK